MQTNNHAFAPTQHKISTHQMRIKRQIGDDVKKKIVMKSF